MAILDLQMGLLVFGKKSKLQVEIEEECQPALRLLRGHPRTLFW